MRGSNASLRALREFEAISDSGHPSDLVLPLQPCISGVGSQIAKQQTEHIKSDPQGKKDLAETGRAKRSSGQLGGNALM